MITDQGFAQLWTNRVDRWSLIKRFIADWRGALRPEDGLDREVIAAAERRLGIRLPEALHEWYLMAGARQEFMQSQDPWVTPSELAIHDGWMVVLRENQSVEVWGIREADLRLVDPPVWIEDVNGVRRPDSEEGRPFSEFVMLRLVMDTKFRARWWGFGDVTSATVDALSKGLQDLGLKPGQLLCMPHRVYGGPSLLVEVVDHRHVEVAAAADDARWLADRLIPGLMWEEGAK